MVWWLRRLRAAGLFHPLAEKFFEIKKRLVDLFRGLRRGGLAYSAAFANPQFVTPLFTGKKRSFLDHFCP
jgi:hypothetical protein